MEGEKYYNPEGNGSKPSEFPKRELKPLSSYGNGGFNGNPKSDKRKISTWNDRVKASGLPYRIFNVNHLTIFNILILVALVVGVGYFVYFGNSGKFSPTLVDNSTCINNPSVCNCNYNLSCGNPNVTIKFPEDLRINIDSLNFTKYNQTCLTACLNGTNSS